MSGIVDIAQVLPIACNSGGLVRGGLVECLQQGCNGKAVFVIARLMPRWIAKQSDIVILGGSTTT